jgi:hypothetical protein
VFDRADTLKNMKTFGYVGAKGSDNVIIGFNVDNVDSEYERLHNLGVNMLNELVTHPWGARSFQFNSLFNISLKMSFCAFFLLCEEARARHNSERYVSTR